MLATQNYTCCCGTITDLHRDVLKYKVLKATSFSAGNGFVIMQ
jgi:hypothetical protein